MECPQRYSSENVNQTVCNRNQNILVTIAVKDQDDNINKLDTEALLEVICMDDVPILKTEIISRLERGILWKELFHDLNVNSTPLPPKLVSEFMKRVKYCSESCASYFRVSIKSTSSNQINCVPKEIIYNSTILVSLL